MTTITAGAIITDDDKKILLVKRPSDKKLFPNAWAFPGGKLEEGESLDETVVREVKEETGLDLISFKKYTFTEYLIERSHNISHIYIGEAEGTLIPETEAKRYSYDEIKGLEIAFNQTEIMEKLHNDGML